MRALQDELARRGDSRRNVSRIVGAVLFNTLVLTIFGLTLLPVPAAAVRVHPRRPAVRDRLSAS